MKHHRILYRALSALLCLGLCAQLTACGKKPVPKPGSSGPSAPSVSKKVYDDSLITEVYDEEDSFTDEYGTEYSYICHVPQLEADTPEAKAINWEIMESFGNDVQTTLDAAESGETPNSQYMEVTWQSYWNDSLLSLSTRVLGWTSDLIDYAVYHYDFETGQRPDNLELLDRFHVDEGDFIAALRRGAARQFDSHYAPWGTGGLSPEDENYGGIAIDLAALRAWTVAEENFSLDLAMFCPNGDGTFTAFQPVASIAGGNGWYYEPVLVEPGPGDWADGGPQAEDAFVSAWLTLKGFRMKNFKRIAALAGVVILLLVFCLPMVFAWGSSENSQALFRGAFAAAVLVPIVAYVFWMAYRIWGPEKPKEDENRMIENVIFDVGNVLMGYDWEEYLKSYNFPEEKYEKIADATFRNPIWEEQDRALHEESWYVDKFVESAPEYEKDIREVVRRDPECMHLYDYAETWVKYLKNQGYHLYVLSNYGTYMLERTKKDMPFLKYMDGVVFSCDVQQIKPEVDIYETLLKRYDLKPEKSVFMDDRAINCEGARKAGIRTIQFENLKQAAKELEELGVK